MTPALNLEITMAPVRREVEQPKPTHMTPAWWDGPFNGMYKDQSRMIVKQFIEGTLPQNSVGRHCANSKHIYYTKNDGQELWLFKDNLSLKVRVCVAKKIRGQFIGNASSLVFLKQQSGKVMGTGGSQLMIQEAMADCMLMVPFQLFKDAQLDINSFEVIEAGPQEHLTVRRGWSDQLELRHFTGAMLFRMAVNKRSQEVQGRKHNYYLFDIDRNDLEEKTFNSFMTRLSRPCTSIADAYDSLKPQEIKDAERFMEKPCPRQGEWFFIPVAGEFTAKAPAEDQRGREIGARLESKGHSPHFVSEICEEGYVRGRVTHSRGEHHPLELKGWHKPVANAGEVSFRITGAID